MATLSLPTANGKTERYTTGEPIVFKRGTQPRFNRVAYAAAHVVANPLADVDPWLDTAIDWDKTIAFRHYLWDLGLGVAEAMDTAQRGGGLDWPAAKELIRRALAAAKSLPGVKIACGVGTDHLAPGANVKIDDIIRAYEEQVEAVEAMGGQIVLMASRALAAVAKSPDDYAKVYGRILSQVREPVMIHWLGEMFDPALAGYWGADDHMVAMESCLGIIQDHAAKVDGVKISLLSTEKEIEMRRRLPDGVKMYTGDDFNYAELIAGDEEGYSHALLGGSERGVEIGLGGVRQLAEHLAGRRIDDILGLTLGAVAPLAVDIKLQVGIHGLFLTKTPGFSGNSSLQLALPGRSGNPV